jgi:hypothetical protein
MAIQKGDRVRLSAEGRALVRAEFRKHRLGTCLSSKSFVVVHWDGNSPRTVESYHPKFIERAERPDERPAGG